jgi:hydrogenase maturation protease
VSGVLVAGIGNIFRTDDGFGPAVVERLGRVSGARVVDYGIRGMHLAYDLLAGWDALVLIDALPDRGTPGRLAVLEIGAGDVVTGGPVDAHGMDPATVLATLHSLGGRLPARTVLVGCEVSDTGHGIGLTPTVRSSVDSAAAAVRSVLAGVGVG